MEGDRMTVYIYGLFDPRNLDLRYIGKSKSPHHRLIDHISEAKRELKNNHKNNWIRQLLNDGLTPAVEILEECAEDTWEESEKAWITECKKFGVRLTNVTKGGENPPVINELPELQQLEIKAKWSKTRMGRPSANIGRTWSQEYKDKMSKALSGNNNPMFGKFGKDHPATGRIVSKETKEKLSERVRGKKNPMFGKTHSDEAKKKLSIAGKGRKQTWDEKKKKSLTNKMCRALKKGLVEKVRLLQEEYFNLFGCYYIKYLV